MAIDELNPNIKPEWDLYDTTENNIEYALYDSTIVEYNDISGFVCEYRILLSNYDTLMGEDPNCNLSDGVLTKISFNPSDEQSILDMFGITADDTMEMTMIPISTFNRDLSGAYNTLSTSISANPPLLIIPKVGDVLTTIYNQRNYEIVSIGQEDNIFNAKKFVYNMILKPYRFSEQSDSHRDVHIGLIEDPFATITEDGYEQNNFGTVEYGDNSFIEEESDKIDDYDDVLTSFKPSDPDKDAFGY